MRECDAEVRRAMWRASLARGVPADVVFPALLTGDLTVLPEPVARAWDNALRSAALDDALESEAEKLQGLGGRVITPVDAEWPASCPPGGVLRVRGALPGRGAIAIVGSRQGDAYGREIAGRVAEAAVAAGRQVVSGGAYGIDAAAHRATIECGGATIVVLGGGLDRAGPAAHRRLFDEALVAGGGWVSPFPCGARPARWTFLRRNRWIAGLSEAVVVVQAGIRSGARSTASAARALGRPVWAVPGPMDAPLHRGCHVLIRDGASVMMSATDWMGDTAGLTGDPSAAPPESTRPLWAALSVEPETLGIVGARAGISGHDAARMATELELGGWVARTADGRLRRRDA